MSSAHPASFTVGVEEEYQVLDALPEVVSHLLSFLRPALDDDGAREEVDELAGAVLAEGTGAERQRRAYRRRGLISDVVELIVAETGSGVGPAVGAGGATRRTLL